MGYFAYKPYVPVAKRREQASRKLAGLQKSGAKMSPVVIERRTIASSFWGKSWCDNLERYSDYASRLPRGRSYVRNGSVLDLQIAKGEITAKVSGSDLYTIRISNRSGVGNPAGLRSPRTARAPSTASSSCCRVASTRA